MALVLQTFKEQQRKDGHGPYKFQRKTERQLDTLNNDGWGNPVNPVGLIVSSFRPSDDATTFGFPYSFEYVCRCLIETIGRDFE